MAFNSITIGSEVYNSIGNGIYQLSTILFGSAGKLIKITPGKLGSNKITTCSITRHLEKDVVEGTVTTRRKLAITCQLQVPAGFTSTEVSSLMASFSTFSTVANIDRVLQGES